jgi:hypothetical protein
MLTTGFGAAPLALAPSPLMKLALIVALGVNLEADARLADRAEACGSCGAATTG